MQSLGLAANTIQQRVSLVRQRLGTQEYVSLPPRHNVRESKWLVPEQVRAILTWIPNKANGRRDLALIASSLCHRRSPLKHCDVRTKDSASTSF